MAFSFKSKTVTQRASSTKIYPITLLGFIFLRFGILRCTRSCFTAGHVRSAAFRANRRKHPDTLRHHTSTFIPGISLLVADVLLFVSHDDCPGAFRRYVSRCFERHAWIIGAILIGALFASLALDLPDLIRLLRVREIQRISWRWRAHRSRIFRSQST